MEKKTAEKNKQLVCRDPNCTIIIKTAVVVIFSQKLRVKGIIK